VGYNRVYFVDPCIPDYYGGDAAYEAEAVGLSGLTYAFPYQFRGRNFLEGVFAQLAVAPPVGLPSLEDASLIVLYAWSGGGRHVIQNLDRLAWDADGDHAADGGYLATLAPDATVRGVVSSRFQPGLEVQELFVDTAAALGRVDANGETTGAGVSAEEAGAFGSIYDVTLDHGADHRYPLPSHDDACAPATADPPLYPPFDEADDGCWSATPYMSNAAFRAGGSMHDLLSGWGYTRDASCLAAHPDAPDTCYDFQHVLAHHVVSDVFVYIAQHDQAYRSPGKLPTYADEDAYYLAPSEMRSRVIRQLSDISNGRFSSSELATGQDPSCTDGDCVDPGFATFAPDLWLHDDPVNSGEAAFGVHLCGPSGPPVSLSDALQAWAERTTSRVELGLVEGVGGVTRCEDGADADGDGLVGCDDPEWAYALQPGSDTVPACPTP